MAHKFGIGYVLGIFFGLMGGFVIGVEYNLIYFLRFLIVLAIGFILIELLGNYYDNNNNQLNKQEEKTCQH